jgi:hypothetical protein
MLGRKRKGNDLKVFTVVVLDDDLLTFGGGF